MLTLLIIYLFFSVAVLTILLHYEYSWDFKSITLQEASLLFIYTLGSAISFGYILYRLSTGSVDIATNKVIDNSEDSGC